MADLLTIDLCEGFAQTATVVRVDGREVLRDNVTTRQQIAHARRIEQSLVAARALVEVELPDLDLWDWLNVEAERPFVCVDVVDSDFGPRLRIEARSQSRVFL